MKKTIVLVFILSLSFVTVYAQHGESTTNYVSSEKGSLLKVTEMPLQKGETQGSIYLEKDWYYGNLELEGDKVILDYPLKYNLKSGELEIKVTWDSIRVVNFSKIERFTWEGARGSEYFVNAKKYTGDSYEVNVNGFFKVLEDGETKLFENSYLELLPSSYNTAMDAGRNYDEYTKKNKLYIYKDGKLSQVKKNKKSVLSAMNDKETEVKLYAKENKLKYRKAEDITSMVKYYNSL